MLTDITKFKKIEEELRRSEQRFLAIALNTRSFVWEIDNKGIITYASPAIEGILGVRPDEAVGKIRWFDLFDPSVREDLTMAIMATLDSGQSFREVDIICHHKNGSLVILKVSGTPVLDEDGTCTGYYGLCQDITTEKEAEEKLVESEARYRLLADNVHDIIWTVDEHLHFTYVSPSIKEFLGITPKEAVEEPFIGFLTPESLQRYSLFKRQLVDSIQMGIQFPRKTELNLEFKHKNGSTVWTEILITIVYDSNKKFRGIVGVTRDISRRRQAEEALMRANRHLSLLSGITRHDILNKITAILGFVFLSRETKTSPDTLAYLKKIESATNEIKVLIEFTKYYENLGSTQPTWQNLNTVLGQMRVPEHLKIETDLQNYSILADPMLEKVFFNLLDNSLRHGEKVSKIRVYTCKNEDCLNVIWEDNGIGIAEEDKEFIFERGFGKNTGLGMFLVREILSLTDISITENGKPGVGARFEMKIPRESYRIES